MKFKNEAGEELTLDQILEDSEYQAEFDKKVEKALNKNKIDIDAEVQKKLDEAIAGREEEIRKNIQEEMERQKQEAEENAKLTEAEKYKKELDKVNQRLTDAENKNKINDRRDAVEKYIKEKGYDRDAIMDFVNVESLPDAFQDKIDTINDKLNDRINKGVNERLKDVDEKELGGKGGNDKPVFDFNFQSVKPEVKK